MAQRYIRVRRVTGVRRRIDKLKFDFHSKLSGNSLCQLGVKSNKLAVFVLVVHRLVNGVTNDQLFARFIRLRARNKNESIERMRHKTEAEIIPALPIPKVM